VIFHRCSLSKAATSADHTIGPYLSFVRFPFALQRYVNLANYKAGICNFTTFSDDGSGSLIGFGDDVWIGIKNRLLPNGNNLFYFRADLN
jgi:hypothetical protein